VCIADQVPHFLTASSWIVFQAMTDGLAANVQDTNVTNAANKSILTRKSLWKIVVGVGDTIQRVTTERSMARNERIKLL
tara:strand:- start:274 stop:510 length:237 start_codon:yes stop_codon:yes gene_type:complete